jgi:hypothetical protein
VDSSEKIARAAVQPESVYEDLLNLTLTEEALSTAEALHPSDLKQMRMRLQPLLRLREDYTMLEAAQLALFFRDESLTMLINQPALGLYMQDVFDRQKTPKKRPRRMSIKGHERHQTDLERSKER